MNKLLLKNLIYLKIKTKFNTIKTNFTTNTNERNQNEVEFKKLENGERQGSTVH